MKHHYLHYLELPEIYPQQTLHPDPATVGHLFIQSAGRGALKLQNASENLYRLTLYDVTPYMVFFAERPKRIAGTMPVEQFIEHWHQGGNEFQMQAPHAGIAAGEFSLTGDAGVRSDVLKLKDPRYDSIKRIFTYDVYAAGTTCRLIEGEYQNMCLFIDRRRWHAVLSSPTNMYE